MRKNVLKPEGGGVFIFVVSKVRSKILFDCVEGIFEILDP